MLLNKNSFVSFRTIRTTFKRLFRVCWEVSAKTFRGKFDEILWSLIAMCLWCQILVKFRVSRFICTMTPTHSLFTVLGIKASTEFSVNVQLSWAFLIHFRQHTREDLNRHVFTEVGSFFKLLTTVQHVHSQFNMLVPPKVSGTWTKIVFISMCSRQM